MSCAPAPACDRPNLLVSRQGEVPIGEGDIHSNPVSLDVFAWETYPTVNGFNTGYVPVERLLFNPPEGT